MRRKQHRGGDKQAMDIVCEFAGIQSDCNVHEIIRQMPNTYAGYSAVNSRLATFVSEKYKEVTWNKDHPASWYRDPFSIRAAINLVFAAQLDSIRILGDLKQNSANCSFTIAQAKAILLSSETSLFVKVIDYPTKKGIDSILVDNVNGKISNWFMHQYPEMRC